MKDKFLKELELGLLVFKKKKAHEYIEEYKKMIDGNIFAGDSEEMAVAKVGNLDDILRTIYDENDLNVEYVPSKNKFKKSVRSFGYTLNNVIEVMSHNKAASNLKIIGGFIVILLFVALVKIPFIFVRDIVSSFFNIFASGMVLNVWTFAIEIIYIIVAIIVFMRIFKIWFNKVKVTYEEVDQKFNQELEGFKIDE